MNMVREEVQDKRVIELIKRFLKSGVMENGLHIKTEEGSPQGGPLSPLLANIYLNKFDHEMESRGVHVIRYADDIVVLARTPRTGQRLLESNRRYLEGKLKLRMNTEKSRVVSVYAIRNFKISGLCTREGEEWSIHSSPCKVPQESKAEAQRIDFPQSGQKRPSGDVQGKSIHPRMAWLLLHSEYAKHYEKLGRMAETPSSDVYLEAMEETENKIQ